MFKTHIKFLKRSMPSLITEEVRGFFLQNWTDGLYSALLIHSGVFSKSYSTQNLVKYINHKRFFFHIKSTLSFLFPNRGFFHYNTESHLVKFKAQWNKLVGTTCALVFKIWNNPQSKQEDPWKFTILTCWFGFILPLTRKICLLRFVIHLKRTKVNLSRVL